MTWGNFRPPVMFSSNNVTLCPKAAVLPVTNLQSKNSCLNKRLTCLMQGQCSQLELLCFHRPPIVREPQRIWSRRRSSNKSKNHKDVNQLDTVHQNYSFPFSGRPCSLRLSTVRAFKWGNWKHHSLPLCLESKQRVDQHFGGYNLNRQAADISE